jgi:hypothetical protein
MFCAARTTKIQTIAIAYQSLSDPRLCTSMTNSDLRKAFLGVASSMSLAIFGGERFLPFIGQLSLFRYMKTALQEADE